MKAALRLLIFSQLLRTGLFSCLSAACQHNVRIRNSCVAKSHLHRSMALSGKATDWIKGDLEDDPSQRFHANAEGHMTKRKLGLTKSGRCSTCFLSSTLCICQDVKDIFQRNKSASIKADIQLYMHYKEWGRASNTGKLLNTGMPTVGNRTSMYIYGLREEQSALVEHLSTHPSIILYPGANSSSISAYQEWYKNQGEVSICVIDSTWPQSHAMEQSLPAHIPRVKVDDFVLTASQFLNRKQSVDRHKVSTVEAVALALRALGEGAESVQPLYDALQLSVDAVLRQNGRTPAYGHSFVKQIASVGSVGGVDSAGAATMATTISTTTTTTTTTATGGAVEAVSLEQSPSAAAAASTAAASLSSDAGKAELGTGGAGVFGGGVVNGPYTARQVQRPAVCPSCGATNEETIFKNMGLRKPPPVTTTTSSSSTTSAPSKTNNTTGTDKLTTSACDSSSTTGTSSNAEEAPVAGDALRRVWKCQKCTQFFAVVVESREA